MADVPLMFLSEPQIPTSSAARTKWAATYYLRKPFDHNVLLELIDKALWLPHLTAGHAKN